MTASPLWNLGTSGYSGPTSLTHRKLSRILRARKWGRTLAKPLFSYLTLGETETRRRQSRSREVRPPYSQAPHCAPMAKGQQWTQLYLPFRQLPHSPVADLSESPASGPNLGIRECVGTAGAAAHSLCLLPATKRPAATFLKPSQSQVPTGCPGGRMWA